MVIGAPQIMKTRYLYLSASLLLPACCPEQKTLDPPYVYVECSGKFYELGPYAGVRIECDDGRRYLFRTNKYVYTRKEQP